VVGFEWQRLRHQPISQKGKLGRGEHWQFLFAEEIKKYRFI
jgi:hypothetical protein